MAGSVSQPWDTLLKLVAGPGAQAFASLVLPEAVVAGALDRELRVTNIEGDLFLKAYLEGRRTVIHFEFQKKKGSKSGKDEQEERKGGESWEEWENKSGEVDGEKRRRKRDKPMNRRMWEYNCAMDTLMECPVYSILVYLTPEGRPAVGSPYIREIAGTGLGHYFTFLVINLWEVDGKWLKSREFADLLPLLPLTKGGNTRELGGRDGSRTDEV